MDDIVYSEPASKTWRLDLGAGHIRGYIDGTEAVGQAAMMALQTERYQHLIFSDQYGSELHTLVGRDRDYILSEARRMIEDALSVDTRITGVEDYAINENMIKIKIGTIYGQSHRLQTEVIND